MRSLITGGTGFVGLHLARLLRESGDDVFQLSPDASATSGSDVVHGDVRDAESLFNCVLNIRPERVFHLAAISAVGASWDNPELTFDVNVRGTFNVINAASRVPGGCRVLVVSTSQVYGRPSALPLREASPVRPENPYALSKAMAELAVWPFISEGSVEATIVRPFNHSGPGQSQGFVLSSLARQIACGELQNGHIAIQAGDLSVRRDFLDVRDVVRAYQLLMETRGTAEVFNLCSGMAYELSAALDYLKQRAGVEVELNTVTAKLRHRDAPEVYGDASKLRLATGWSPHFSFEKTLDDLLDFWRSELREPQKESFPVC